MNLIMFVVSFVKVSLECRQAQQFLSRELPERCRDTLHHIKHVSAANITSTLDIVLNPRKYDRRLRPGFKEEPVVIYTDILLRSMGPISEKDMVYSIEIYFRQRWMDARLATNMSIENISLNIKVLDKLWHPDTVFYNGRQSYLHFVPTPNRFIRISPNGSMYLSQRLTVRAVCQMELQNYPLDSQICDLKIGSFAYTTEEVVYVWRYGPLNSVQLSNDMAMSQFDLINYSATYSNVSRKGAIHSCLTVRFGLRRHTGYFLLHVVTPCSLLVVLSWVSFWINREATADRIALGTTTVLTMTFLALDTRDELPRVSYATALDLYVSMCFIFVLSTLVQFAIVHLFTKRGHSDTHPHPKIDSSDEENAPTHRKLQPRTTKRIACTEQNIQKNRVFVSRVESQMKVWFSSLKFKGHSVRGKGRDIQANSVSQIDKVCRFVFPVTFVILNIAYWSFYLTRNEFKSM
ncbi:gamma-aminobutyric acid receptor alpha-like [Saccostrea echinata]|uniref:gamma-aminobutyric acid receptor alpha-like n=1 Tax=Saccostrea echinata TaxID=191078 RepID=UPI002A83D235|nr:gamma-aminobutyric acid receptor alpha-like [Saccostrea echinata]